MKICTLEGLSENLIEPLIKETVLDKNKLETCLASPQTDSLLKNQVDWGNTAGIEGTPAIFANGKALPYGWLIPTLEKAYKTDLK